MTERTGDPEPGKGAGADRTAASGPGVQGILAPHLAALAALAREVERRLGDEVERYAGWAEATLRDGGTLFFAGNGGSAATAEHVAAEYVVRFRRERGPLPALALTAGSAALTAAANDFGFEEVYARGLRALGRAGDLLVVHSTSGRSANVVRAAEAAAELGVRTVALLAGDGGTVAGAVDLPLVVPTRSTARAQELHLALEHAVVDRIDAAFAGGDRSARGSAASAAAEGSGGPGGRRRDRKA